MAGGGLFTGGLGADIFYFRNNADLSTVASSADRITDLSRAKGDKIHFWSLDADTTKAGNQAFTFIGTGAFTGVAGQLRYASDGAAGLSVQMDTNGDGVADLFFSLSNVTDLEASDFVLWRTVREILSVESHLRFPKARLSFSPKPILRFEERES